MTSSFRSPLFCKKYTGAFRIREAGTQNVLINSNAVGTPTFRQVPTHLISFQSRAELRVTRSVSPAINPVEVSMDWNRIEGNWKEAKGKIKQKWGQLTDDDLTQVNGRRDQLEGRIQQRYGLAKDMVRKDVDDWLNSQP
jgi:uncharacterized protein YjbJ (UPF0337 family)